MPSHLRRVAANLEDAHKASTARLIALQDRQVSMHNTLMDGFEKGLATAGPEARIEISDALARAMMAVSRAIAVGLQAAKQGPGPVAEDPETIKEHLLE